MKIAGFGLLGLAALMVIPSGVSADVAPMIFYGTADIQLKDADGNVKLLQTVHNQMTDEGEAFLIDQVFDTSEDASTGDDRVRSICLLADSYTDWDNADMETLNDVNSGGGPGTETLSTSGIGAADRMTCGGNSGDVAKAGSTATIGPVEFEAGADFAAGQTVSGFAVCANGGNATHCDDVPARQQSQPPNPQALLAVINISDVGLPNSGDTLTVTYTFDISTDNS